MPEVEVPLPRPDEVPWNDEPDPFKGWFGASWGFDSDPRKLVLEFIGPGATEQGCRSYLDRVVAAGFAKRLLLADDDPIVFWGSDRSRGVDVHISCFTVDRSITVIQSSS